MAYFHWSVLNLVTLPQSPWFGRRCTEHTWLAHIPGFPSYLFFESFITTRQCQTIIFSHQACADLYFPSSRPLQREFFRASVFVGVCRWKILAPNSLKMMSVVFSAFILIITFWLLKPRNVCWALHPNTGPTKRMIINKLKNICLYAKCIQFLKYLWM